MSDSMHPPYDAIVAGTGPGGATAAKELAERGARVLILEWGGGAPFNGTPVQAATMLGMPGKNILVTPQGLIVGRGTTVGGSSALYCASAFEPPVDMFLRRGVDIRKEVEEVRKELPVGPLADRLVGPHARLLSKAAKGLGYAWAPLNKFIYQDKCRLGCFKCYTGCPYGAKWTGRNNVEKAVEKGARLITGARVRQVLVENQTARGVIYSQKGKRIEARAPIVVLGAGGLGTPVILRKSGVPKAGYDFFFDPLIIAFGTVDQLPGTGEVPMIGGVHLADEGIMITDLSVHPMVYMGFTAQVLQVDKVLSHKHAAGLMVKIRDDLGGRLTDRGGIRKNMGQADWSRLSRGYAHAKRILKAAGARDVFKSWYIAGHPGGTAKIGDVVDTNLMTRVQNLYVCDCSVVPEAWGLPPTFTLVSLGKRLAKHLAAK